MAVSTKSCNMSTNGKENTSHLEIIVLWIPGQWNFCFNKLRSLSREWARVYENPSFSCFLNKQTTCSYVLRGHPALSKRSISSKEHISAEVKIVPVSSVVVRSGFLTGVLVNDILVELSS